MDQTPQNWLDSKKKWGKLRNDYQSEEQIASQPRENRLR